MPAVRKVVTRSPKRNVGLINCPWFQNKPIEHESRLEKHFVLRAMLFPGLTSIQHQPFKLTLGGHGQHYTPDFLLSFTNGERLVFEVKRSERIKKLRVRMDEICHLLNLQKLQFFVAHQGQIEGDRRAERAALIRRYAMLAPEDAVIHQVIDYVGQCKKGVAIKVLKKKFHVSPEQILRMLAHREIALSHALLLSDDGFVFPSNLEIKNASIQFGNWFGCAPWSAAARVRPDAGWEQSAV